MRVAPALSSDTVAPTVPSVQTHYVAGFLFCDDAVLLVEKQRPRWQAGLWNGVGGHIEPGEDAGQAMRREFREETGAHVTAWDLFVILRGDWGSVSFFRSAASARPVIRQTTDERVAWWPVHALPPTLPNLHWLLPLARVELAGRGVPFTMFEAGTSVAATP